MSFVFASDDRLPDAGPQLIPEHWLDSPELGAHFSRFVESTTPTKAAKADNKKE